MSNETTTPEPKNTPSQEAEKPRILIGNQRNPDAYRPKPAIPAVDPDQQKQEGEVPMDSPGETSKSEPLRAVSFKKGSSSERSQDHGNPVKPSRDGSKFAEEDEDEDNPDHLSVDGLKSLKNVPLRTESRIQVPRIRGKMSEDLEEEFNALFQDTAMESLMVDVDKVAAQELHESETKLKGTIISLSGEDVFFDLGGRDQGIVPLKQFKELPEAGQQWDVIVMKYLNDEGLYDLTLPLAAADVREWEQIQEGMILSAKITGVNTGGLECEVNRLRGFIPMGQIALFRVEKPEEFIGEMLSCVVLEVNPTRRNLILSRKAMLERERAELREKLLNELEVGQVREGLVRKIIDAGAFVDLGGMDGFVPIGALSWGRVRHPGDVLSEGSRIKVKITKLDLEANRISLAYRDDADNPWSNIYDRFEEKSTAHGKVTKIMDFGAFVELMPGVEGLVHISELTHGRVAQVSDVLKEGDWVDVMIQTIDPGSRRISLSIKRLSPEPVPEPIAESDAEEEGQAESGKKGAKGGKKEGLTAAEPLKLKHKPKGPLKGGVGSSSEGEKFGLKW